MSKYDVVVVGAGLIGAATALAIAKQNSALNVALLERSEPLEPPKLANQRVVALGSVARQVLAEVGVFANMTDAEAFPYTAMQIWDEHSHGELHFKATDLSIDYLGHMVDAQACTAALQQVALSGVYPNLDVQFGCDLQHLSGTVRGATITGADFTARAKLVIGADGSNSWVRRQAGIFANKSNYGQNGIVTNIRLQNGHQDCAWQRFLHTGPVAVLPLKGNRASIVWSVANSQTESLLALSDQEFAVALTDALDNRLGPIADVQARVAFPLSSQQADMYYAPSIALAGDAAHSIHPLAGQGANLGFKDVKAIVNMIAIAQQSEYRSLGSLPDLERYQRARKVDNEQTDWFMSALNSAYQSNQPIWMQLRGLGMNWLDKSSFIKAALAKQAME